MTRALTPIRTLMNLRNVACQRNDAVETASSIGGRSNAEWAAASRVWSRQSEALMLAVIAEPPTNLADALSVLSCLAEMHNQHDATEDQPPHRARDVVEMTAVAIHNCIVALAGNAVPDESYSGTEIRDIDWSAAQVAWWLPKPTDEWAAVLAGRVRFEAAEDTAYAAGTLAWDEARTAYFAAKAAEDAWDNGSYRIAIESTEQQGPLAAFDDHLTDIRGAAEDVLMDIPAPNAAGFALKYIIAKGGGRETDCWDAMLEQEARRFLAPAGENARFDVALAEFKRLRAIELAMSPKNHDEEKALEAATLATNAAFDAMIAIPIADGTRAAAKLAALAALFDLPSIVRDREQFERLLDELLGILMSGAGA